MAAFAFLCVLAPLASEVAALVEATPPQLLRLPEVPLAALLERDFLDHDATATLRASLAELGAVVITGASLGDAAQDSLGAWARCLQRGGEAHHKALKRDLAAGAVLRASVTSGATFEGPRTPWPQCEGAQPSTMDMREAVFRAARALVGALSSRPEKDQNVQPFVIERRSGDASSTAAVTATLHDALSEATHLEHLHVYEEAGADNSVTPLDMKALELHTDAGLLLAFVPPVSAALSSSPFLDVELPAGGGLRRLAAPSSPDSVLFFVGEAAQHLQAASGPRQELRALPHALSLPAGFKWRAWYGVMFLLPKDTLVQVEARALQEGGGRRTFGDVWQAATELAISGGDEGHSEGVGCGLGKQIVDPASSCAEGEIECWMACMPTTGLETCTGSIWETQGDAGRKVEQVDLSVQCLHSVTGARWPDESGRHCGACLPACGRGTPDSDNSSEPAPAPGSGDGFCVVMPGDKGTTMYMDGFKWSLLVESEVCIAFLFPSLVLDARWKFALGCAIAFLLSASLEFIGLGRKNSSNFCVKLVLQGVILALAYVVMLFIMTYSLELFFSVILGLVFGPAMAGAMAGAKKPSSVADESQDAPQDASQEMSEDVGPGAPCCKAAAGMAH